MAKMGIFAVKRQLKHANITHNKKGLQAKSLQPFDFIGGYSGIRTCDPIIMSIQLNQSLTFNSLQNNTLSYIVGAVAHH